MTMANNGAMCGSDVRVNTGVCSLATGLADRECVCVVPVFSVRITRGEEITGSLEEV